jgi:hypothetical protein
VTEAEKKALIQSLGAKSNKAFDAGYSDVNRKWFVGKIIESLIAQGFTDRGIVEQKTKELIAASGVALNARKKKGFSTGSLVNKWSKYHQLKSKIQIIYGMIAMHPRFLEPASATYFDFIVERRFRSIQRMAFFVNPNEVRNVFDYPGNNPMKVNKDATAAPPLWKGEVRDSIPFVLTNQGKSDPTEAVKVLFKENKGADRNLFACDPLATILHMDSLLEAKDPDKLLKALAGVGDHYLKIDHPDGHLGNYADGQILMGVTSAQAQAGTHKDIELGKIGPVLSLIQTQLTAQDLRDDNYVSFSGPDFTIVQGDAQGNGFKQESFKIDKVNPVTRVIRIGDLKNAYDPGAKLYLTRTVQPLYKTLPFHFLSDTRPDQALFEQLTVRAADLQVGDHVYVINHPLYLIFYPSGIWGGEHSFISEIENRNVAASLFRTTLKVEGHGLPQINLLQMMDRLQEWINQVLAILRSLAKIHLSNLEKNKRPPATTTVNAAGFKFKFIKRNENGRVMNVFEYDMPYKYSVILKGTLKTFNMTKGFVIKEQASNADNEFQVFSHVDTDSVNSKGKPLTAVFIGAGAAEQFKLSKWAVPFFNERTVRFDVQPLFKSDNKTPNPLTFNDIVKSKPFFTTDNDGDAYVIRPRVNFSPTYQTFLKSSGAI